MATPDGFTWAARPVLPPDIVTIATDQFCLRGGDGSAWFEDASCEMDARAQHEAMPGFWVQSRARSGATPAFTSLMLVRARTSLLIMLNVVAAALSGTVLGLAFRRRSPSAAGSARDRGGAPRFGEPAEHLSPGGAPPRSSL